MLEGLFAFEFGLPVNKICSRKGWVTHEIWSYSGITFYCDHAFSLCNYAITFPPWISEITRLLRERQVLTELVNSRKRFFPSDMLNIFNIYILYVYDI